MKKVFLILVIYQLIIRLPINCQEKPLSWEKYLKLNGCTPSFSITKFNYNYFNKPILFTEKEIKNDVTTIYHEKSKWTITISAKPIDNGFQLAFNCKVDSGNAESANLGLQLTFNNWSATNYVLMPGAAYNGNRFESRKIKYSPKLLDPRDIAPDKPQIISDVPRLNITGGPSKIQERSGAMTIPCIGFQSPGSKKGFLMITDQATNLGDNGFTIEESRDRQQAVISLTVPVVREFYSYNITDNQQPSKDKPVNFKAGDEVSFSVRLYFFQAPAIEDLFDNYFKLRSELYTSNLKPLIPFSACFSEQEAKYNSQNWVEKYGYYSVGMRENFLQDWQIGWTGGIINTYPLLFAGNDSSQNRVIRNFNWLFPNGICPAGFFWDSGEQGTLWYGGDIRKPHTKNWHLIRKSGDGLYYVVKQLMLMKKRNIDINENWSNGAKTVANSFVKLWDKWQQFGQFIDSQTGDIVVGGSTSGAIIPAALILSYQYFNNPEYLRVAKISADSLYNHFVKKGITCGGPGDALQNPDSESAYAMLESFMLLYETTQDKIWLSRAQNMANQFSTWVMPYNYSFPENSTLGKMGVKTRGIVFANTQNKHGAPGICTYSGVALWRLYRATGDQRYMELLKEIAFTMPQYLSHSLNPIEKMKTGWMSERVSTTDWMEGIGELMYGSTWAEISLMLSYIELPGVYVQPDKSYICIIDNIEGNIIKDTSEKLSIRLSNPTKAIAKVKLLSELSKECLQPLHENALWNCKIITLQPGENTILEFKKH